MSPVCHNFVQNAWKKDFCSNCFKSRDEHLKNERTNEVSKYTSTAFQNRATFFKKTPPSILKVHPKKKNKRNVRFPEEVSSVIGYGGDDWSDDEEFQMSEENEDDDTFPDTEEEKELHKITKSNTDFNTVKANLLGGSMSEAKKSYTSLLLGKIQTDQEGKKKTLMVSVTPFGYDNKKNSMVKSHSRKPAVIHLTNTRNETDSNNYKTSIILSSYIKDTETIMNNQNDVSSSKICAEKSLLEEISETLEQNRISSATELALSRSSSDKTKIIENQDITEPLPNEELDKKETGEVRKNSIVRNSPITRNQERPKVNLSNRSEFKFCKINIENDGDSAAGTLNSTPNNSITSDDDSFNGRTDSDNDDSGNFSETRKSEEHVKIKVFNDNDACKNKRISKLENWRRVEGQADITCNYTTFQSPILDMPSIIPKTHDNDLFSAEASRESAGEPDGRADPDELIEAPALPSSPVPAMDPRPSFLHGMITETLPTKPAIPEKPKLPVKPLCVHKQTITKKPIIAIQQQVVMQISLKEEEEKSTIGLLTDEKNNEITEIREDNCSETIYYAKPALTKQDSDTSLNGYNKRKAPMPPPSPIVDEPHSNLYQRNQNTNVKSDPPVIRGKEKRERTSMIPKSKSVDDNSDNRSSNEVIPAPAPRKNISLSHDNLLMDEKRKGKLKFSIKKLLRIGLSKDLDKKEFNVATESKLACKNEDISDLTPKPKPRLVIIHPLDINGSSVEVVKSNCEIVESLRRVSHDDSSSVYSGSSSATDFETPVKVVNKPPPPPRHIVEETKGNNINLTKPVRPPPPKSIALQKKQKQQAWASPHPSTESNIYANLGEIRSAIAPRKPERTASMREREAQLELPKRRVPIDDKDENDDTIGTAIVQATNETVINNYDDVYDSQKYDNDSCIEDINCDSAKNSDSDYEYVNHARSSSPECDSGIKSAESNMSEERIDFDIKENMYSKSGAENSSEFTKYSNGIFNRSSSLPYCGSETESEIYSPYSFYSPSDVLDSPVANDDYQGEMTPKNTTNKLRIRKGRSVVHKNLEDNYGAVVIANHEALAQVLEQVQQSATMQPSLRGLKACTNLRWTDFAIQPSSCNFVKAGKRLFYPAIWNSNQGPVNVTLMLCKDQIASQIVCQQSVQPQSLSLNAVTEFCDLVPLQQFGEEGEELVQATIAVLAHAHVDTIQSYGDTLYTTEFLHTKEYQLVQSEQTHEAIFMMLQLINGLKYLQARGVEEIPDSLTSFIALREAQPNAILHGSTITLPQSDDRLTSLSAPKTNSYGRLCILQGLSEEINCNKSTDDESRNSLCNCAIRALEILLPGDKLAPLLSEMLQEERAVSLNQAKSVLEFTLWGPLDVVQGVPVEERELSLQRWLDLERATVLHGLVRTRIQLNTFEQLHLMFLVRTSAKSMCDASVFLEKAKVC